MRPTGRICIVAISCRPWFIPAFALVHSVSTCSSPIDGARNLLAGYGGGRIRIFRV